MVKRFISEKVETGEIIIFDTVTKNTHVLNETAALVYEQYNKNCPIDEIVNVIKKIFGKEYKNEKKFYCNIFIDNNVNYWRLQR